MTDEPPWIELVSASEAAWIGSIDTTVALTLSGTPQGDSASTWRVAESRVTAEPVDQASVEIALRWDDAQLIASGALQPAVAYMQGRLKPAGDMKAILKLLEAAASSDFSSWIRTLGP